MLKRLGIAEFRKHMKTYLEGVSKTKGTIYQIGTENRALLMSPETLTQMQKRHYINMWVKQQLGQLKLEDYVTLADGIKTGALPLDTILGLMSFFELVAEMAELLARPTAKDNAMRWDISDYIDAAINERPIPSRGRFSVSYEVMRRLFDVEYRKILGEKECKEVGSFYLFFVHIRDEMTGMLYEGVTDKIASKRPKVFKDSLTAEQAECVVKILYGTSNFVTSVIEFQSLGENSDRYQEQLILLFQYVKAWYTTYVRSENLETI